MAIVPNIYTCNKWLSFFACFMVMVVGGTSYAFSAYASYLKQLMHFDQYQLMLIATAGNLGNLLGFLGSTVFDIFGPRPTVILGSALLFFAYFAQFVSAFCQYFDIVPWYPRHFIYFVICSFIFGNGAAALYTASVGTNVANFDVKIRGITTGFLVSALGVCGAVFAQLFVLYCKIWDPLEAVVWFLLTGAIVCGGVPIVFGLPFINITPSKVSWRRKKKKADDVALDEETQPIAAAVETKHELEPEQKEIISPEAAPTTLETEKPKDVNLNPLQMLRTVTFWCLLYMAFGGIGSGMVIINNMGTLVQSYSFGQEDGHLFVIFISIFSAIGKVVVGFLSDRIAPWISRTGILTISFGTIGFVCLCLIYSPVYMFYIFVPLFGFAYGGVWGIMPSVCRDLYGSSWFGINLTLIQVGSSMATILLNTILASYIYQSNIFYPKGKICWGYACYRDTFFILFGLCSLSVLVGLILMGSSRSTYNAILRTKALEQAKLKKEKTIDS